LCGSGTSRFYPLTCRLLVSNYTSLPYANELYLLDSYTGTEIYLGDKECIAYAFESQAGNHAGRFYLVRKGTLLTPVLSDDTISINKNNGWITITSAGLPIVKVMLYTLSGQLLYQSPAINSTVCHIETNRRQRTPVIIKVQTQHFIKITRLIL